MKTFVRPLLLNLLGLALLLVAPAQATTLQARTTEQLFGDAQLVAVANVRTVKAERVGGRIITRVHLAIAESFKGVGVGTTVEVLVPGGQVGEWVQRVEGTPVLTAGERCVVFLSPGGGGLYRFTGLEQGKLRVDDDASNPLGGVVRRTVSARLVEGSASQGREIAAPQLNEPLKPYLENLRRLARSAR